MNDIVGEIQGFKIEQGPAVLRLVAFAAGAASLFCSVFLMINPTNALFHPVMYILYVYIAVFAATTMLFEAKHEWIEKVPVLDKYHSLLLQHCEFLTLMGGRGLFYIFQATLWLTFANSFSEIMELASALGLGFVGLLHIFAHAGIMPHQIADKAVAVTKTALVSAERATGVDINQNGKV